MRTHTRILIGVGLVAAAIAVAPRANAAAEESCSADGMTKFICGLASPEDLIHISRRASVQRFFGCPGGYLQMLS